MNPVAASAMINQFAQMQNAAQVGSAPSTTNPGAGSSPAIGKTSGGGGFADLVTNFVEQTNTDQITAESAIESFATGKTDNVQQVVMAMTKADMSFQLFMEIRNHVIDSYNELMRMQF